MDDLDRVAVELREVMEEPPRQESPPSLLFDDEMFQMHRQHIAFSAERSRRTLDAMYELYRIARRED